MSQLLPRSVLPRFLLRLVVAVVLLVFVFRTALQGGGGEDGGFEALREAWIGDPTTVGSYFAAAMAIIACGIAVNAWRFRGLLRAAGLQGRFAPLFRAYVVAGFFNLVLPGAILGDAYRVVDARRDTASGSSALGLIVLERLLGLSALGSIGLVTLPFVPLDDVGEGLTSILIGFSSAFLLGTLLAIHPRSNAVMRRVVGSVGRLVPTASGRGQRVLAAVGSMWDEKPTLLATFGYSLIAQGLMVVSVWFLAMTLDARVDWYWFPVIIPFATLVSLAPISIGGVGVREYLYVTLFGAVGMDSPSALALALTVFAALLAVGFVGLAVFVTGRKEASSS